MRQLGLALHNYHGQFDTYPSAMPASYELTDGTIVGAYFYSVFGQLLPFLDRTDLYNQINCVNGPDTDEQFLVNHSAMRRSVQVFLCPSDAASSVRRFGGINFRVNIGPGAGTKIGPEGPGAFDLFDWIKARDVLDGQSHTIAMSEKTIGDLIISPYNERTNYLKVPAPPFPLGQSLPDPALEFCTSLDRGLYSTNADGGGSWLLNGFAHTWYSHVMGPNAGFTDCSFHTPLPYRYVGEGVFPARSYHRRGVNVLMMDGSSRFVHDGIDLTVWRAISTRRGGEPAQDMF